VSYTYTITIPLKMQVEALEERERFGPGALNEKPINFVVEFASKTRVTQKDVTQAEAALTDFLKGKPVPTDTDLMRCVTKVAASCMAETQPAIDRLYQLRPTFPKVEARVVINGHLSCGEERESAWEGAVLKPKDNFREILLQIIDVIGIPKWKDKHVVGFLDIAHFEAMADLLDELPKDKRGPITDHMFGLNRPPGDIYQIFGPYYTLTQIQAAMVARMKKQVAEHIIRLLDDPLTPAKRDRVFALLEQLSFRQ
jgi:hypothetical protein